MKNSFLNNLPIYFSILGIIYPYASGYGSMGGTSSRDNFLSEDVPLVRKATRIEELAELARDGNVQAMRKLGRISYQGRGVKQSTRIAIKWWKEAAEHGDAPSMMYLGDLYRTGDGVKKNAERAFSYYKEALEATEDSSDKIKAQAIKTIYPRIVKLPLSVTLSWLKERCNENDIEAMYVLGSMPEKRMNELLSKDESKAHLIRAAIGNHETAKELIAKAPIMEYEEYWDHVAENQPPTEAVALAKRLLSNSQCTEAEKAKAIQYYSIAARRHNKEAEQWLTTYQNEQIDECLHYLKAGRVDKAKEALVKLEDEPFFNANVILRELLVTSPAYARSVELVLGYVDNRQTESQGGEPLPVLAIRNKQPKDIIQVLAKAGFDLNASDPKTQETPLMIAAQQNNTELVAYLLKVDGIDTSARNKKNQTAAELTTSASCKREFENFAKIQAEQKREKQEDFLEQLLTQDDDERFYQLVQFIANNEKEALAYLLEKGLPANIRNKGLKDIFSCTDEKVEAEAAAHLLNNYPQYIDTICDLKLFSFDETLLYHAVLHGNTEIAQMLINYGADVNAHSNYGRTPLFAAAYSNNPVMVEMLLKAGAAPSIHQPIYVEAYHNAEKAFSSRDVNQISLFFQSRTYGASTTIANMATAGDIPPATAQLIKNELKSQAQNTAQNKGKVKRKRKTNNNKIHKNNDDDSLLSNTGLSIGGGILLLAALSFLIRTNKKTPKEPQSTIAAPSKSNKL